MEKTTKSIFQRISIPAKTAFFACLIAGLLVHLFAFTNIIPNSDGLARVYDTQQMTVSGRWFLHYATSLNGYVQSPALIGVLSVLFLSLSSALITEILDIKSRLFSAFCGILTVVFPSVAYTYMYMFTASAYSVGIFLAVLSVFICKRFRFGFIPATLTLALATGIYQAYFSVASAVCVCSLILLVFSNDTAKSILKKALYYIIMLCGGLALYYAILKIFLAAKHLKLLSYLGMSSVSLSPKSLISGIISSYKQFILYFFRTGTESYITKAVVIVNVLTVSALVGALVVLIRKNKGKNGISKAVILVLLFAVLPLCCNVMGVLSPATPIMRYAFVFVYILVLALCSKAFAGIKFTVLSPQALVTFIFSIFVLLSCQTANTVYTAAATSHRATQTFASNLVLRVESTEGYKNGMEVVIIGTFPVDIYYNTNVGFDTVEHYSCDPNSAMLRNKHIYQYLNEWLNIPWKMPDEETMISVSNSEEFRKMPQYPDSGSVKIIDGRIVVRIAKEYLPLEQYEIDYENRR